MPHISTNNQITSNNKRIAKNTILLYIRMLVTMLISLYTSRVVLNTLGVEDFGIYNVVAGVVVLFSFVNNAMATGTQRHISYELGKQDGRLAEVFSACLKIHVFLGFIFVLLGEIVGLWFLNSQLNIPPYRMFAANVIYQIALLNCFVSIIKTPYDASIIAYEKMTFYAYMSIFDAVSRLMLVYLLFVLPFDKLIAFSSLIFLVGIIGLFFCVFYAHKKLNGIDIVKVKDKGLYKYLFSFSGWTLFGSISNMLETQGLNMIINIFYGVVLNAAVGIANQIRGVLNQFVTGFQQALNPQLVMSESSGDRNRQYNLIFRSAKFSFFIMFAVSLPVMANLHQIIFLWLGKVPDYTVSICILIIVLQLFECISSPFYTTIFAIGKIKWYQICVSLFRTLSVVFAFVICYFDIEPWMIYLMPCIVSALLLFYRVWFIHNQIKMPINSFLRQVLVRVILVCLTTIIPLIAYKQFVFSSESLALLIVESICIFSITLFFIFFVGLTSSERSTIFQQVRKYIKI